MNISIVSKASKNYQPDLTCYFTKAGQCFSSAKKDPKNGNAVSICASADSLELHIAIDKLLHVEGDEAIRTAGGTSIKELQKSGYKNIAWYLDGETPSSVFDCLVTGAQLAAYSYTEYKSKSNLKDSPVKLTVFAGKNAAAFRRRLNRLIAIDAGVSTARDLANLPGCDLVPLDLAAFAKDMAKREGLVFKSLSAAQLERGGYAGLVNVGRGSANPPVLFTLTHNPAKVSSKAKPLCLVGKGLTFDAGGINLKPFDGMWNMKADMGGAACVVGAMQSIARLNIPTKVTAVVAAAQNMPDGNAYLPGDILRYRNGRTVEVQNTDAEGRLVLADALLYAQDTLKQRRIVDFATLTGACARALGPQYIGMMTRADLLKKQVQDAASLSGEAVWELPLNVEYRKLLESTVADVRNIGGPIAGAQTAGWFLHEFIKDRTEYVHLDIAGSFIVGKADKYWSAPGMTGSGTRLAVELADLSASR